MEAGAARRRDRRLMVGTGMETASGRASHLQVPVALSPTCLMCLMTTFALLCIGIVRPRRDLGNCENHQMRE